METTQVPINRRMDKEEWYIYAMEYYLAIMNKILPLAAMWLDPEMVIPSEVSQGKAYII